MRVALLVAALLAACGPDPLPEPFDPSVAERALPEVVAALREGNGPAALEKLDARAAQGPLPEGALLYRALALQVAGRDAEAQQALRAELDAHPGDGRARAQLARLLFAAGKDAEAQAELDLARQLVPADLTVRLLTARQALRRQDDEIALRAFQDVLAAEPWGAAAAEAHEGLAQVFGRRGAEGAELAQQHAQAAAWLTDLGARLRESRARLARDPRDVEAALGVAGAQVELFHATGDARIRDAAEAALARVLELRPEDARALCGLSTLRGAQRRLPEALDLAQRAVQSDPALIVARLNLALLHAQLGHTDQAVQELEVIAAEAPDPADRARAHVHIAHLLQDAADEAVRARAAGHARAALELLPDDPFGAAKLLEKLAPAPKTPESPPGEGAASQPGPP